MSYAGDQIWCGMNLIIPGQMRSITKNSTWTSGITFTQPIRAEKWKRLTFVYTTGAYLMTANTVEELVVRSEERELLWKSLRERAALGKRYQVESIEDFTLPLDLFTLLAQSSAHENRDQYDDLS